MKKSTTQKLKEAKEEIKELRKKLEEVEFDRQKFRNHFSNRLRWYIKLLGENKAPDMRWLVEDEARFYTKVNWWFW